MSTMYPNEREEFGWVLKERDMKRESMTERAQALEAALRKLAQATRDTLSSHKAELYCCVLTASRLFEAERLLESLAESTPVAPAGASEPPKKWIPTEGCTCYLCRAARLSPAPVSPVEPTPSINCPLCGEAVQQVSSATLSLALSQHVLWACRRAPNKVEPTPEPPTESVDEKASKWLKATMLSKGRDEDTLPTAVDRAVRRVLGSCSGESLHRHLVRLVRELAPTGAPAPCVWRDIATAPKDGQMLWAVTEAGRFGRRVTTLRWVESWGWMSGLGYYDTASLSHIFTHWTAMREQPPAFVDSHPLTVER